jgi:FhuF 2Fe-2S C-terminal domain
VNQPGAGSPDITALAPGLAALGPYFAIETHDPVSPPARPWVPLTDLITSPGRLRARVQEVREALAAAAGRKPEDVELRAAASVAQLGLAARMLSPVIGAAVLGHSLAVDAGRARWIPSLGGPFRLSLPAPVLSTTGLSTTGLSTTGLSTTGLSTASPGGGARRDGRAGWDLLDGPIRSLVRTTASLAVSEHVLWGNVSSAVNGAAAMIARTRPDLGTRATSVATGMLGFPALAHSYHGQPVRSYRRRSCCLIYRIGPSAAATYCGDCVLTGPRAQTAARRSSP